MIDGASVADGGVVDSTVADASPADSGAADGASGDGPTAADAGTPTEGGIEACRGRDAGADTGTMTQDSGAETGADAPPADASMAASDGGPVTCASPFGGGPGERRRRRTWTSVSTIRR